jgi:hypothetical protein
MNFFGKIFGKKERKQETFPDIPENMKGVFMKGIGMH